MAPSVNLPAGSTTCRLSMIDTGCDLLSASKYLIDPVQKGHEYMNLPTYSWLLVNDRTGDHMLFDLGMRKDWENAPPGIIPHIERGCPGIHVQNDVPGILTANGLDLAKIKAVVLSHWHFDHTGNMSLLPKSVGAVVGPQFKEQFTPFYPEGKDSPFNAYEFEGRTLTELDPSKFNLEIGGFPAYDYFDDGSFYILHAPGHTKEHIVGLVRTTSSPDTFVFLGADSCHFAGVLRPTPDQPMPDTFSSSVNLSPAFSTPCPCSHFTSVHPTDPQNAQTTPFYRPSRAEGSFYLNPAQALETIQKIAKLDAQPNVLVAIAHDPGLGDALPLFPQGTVNDWAEKGMKEAVLWNWVKHLPRDGKAGVPFLVDGLYRKGVKERGVLPV